MVLLSLLTYTSAGYPTSQAAQKVVWGLIGLGSFSA
jgi:hypothetical protein